MKGWKTQKQFLGVDFNLIRLLGLAIFGLIFVFL